MNEDLKEVLKLWNSGLSMGQIAALMGATRNEIAGAIYRARHAGAYFEPRSKRSSYRRYQPIGNHEAILALNMRTCRYILNEDMSSPEYCLDEVSRGSYCAHHANLCYLPPKDPLSLEGLI